MNSMLTRLQNTPMFVLLANVQQAVANLAEFARLAVLLRLGSLPPGRWLQVPSGPAWVAATRAMLHGVR